MVPTSSSHFERRSAERFLISLPVETDRGPGVTRDASVSGLYLVTEQPLAVGDRLDITMSLPDPDHPESPLPMRFVLHGRVVWVEVAREAAGVGISLDEGSGYLARAS